MSKKNLIPRSIKWIGAFLRILSRALRKMPNELCSGAL
jgi:hypothetical protein